MNGGGGNKRLHQIDMFNAASLLVSPSGITNGRLSLTSQPVESVKDHIGDLCLMIVKEVPPQYPFNG